MEDLNKIKEDKEKIRKALRDGTADGIVGVGIDPLLPKLLVFCSDEERAQNTAREILKGEFLIPVIFLRVRRHKKGFKQTLSAFRDEPTLDPGILFPGAEIEPEGGEGGRVGCFVSLRNRKCAALTAEHLFHNRRKHPICIKPYDDSICTLAGTLKDLGGLKAIPEISSVDCATFLPSRNITLNGHSDMTDDVLDGDQLSMAVKALARRLDGEQGRVLDTDAAIRYPVNLGGSKDQEVLLDHQILVQNAAGEFGSEGDSGSLVVLDEQVASFKRGTGLGLYIAIIDSGKYHFVTPLYACLKAIGATGLYLPSVIHQKGRTSTQAVRMTKEERRR